MPPTTDTKERFSQQIARVAALKQVNSDSPEFRKWRRDTEVLIEQVFGSDTRHLRDFRDVDYSLRVSYVDTPEEEYQEAYRHGLDHAAAILQSFIEELDQYGSGVGAAVGGTALGRLESLFNRFHLVARRLRSRHDNRPTLDVADEYDVQDLVHAVLTVDFDDIRREEWTPSYAGGASRLDFLLKNEQIVVEVKKTRRGLGAREVGDQLLIDIGRYRSHPDCRMLVCFVYDPEGLIGNPVGLENDLSGQRDGLKVRVIVAPKGT